MKDPILKNNNNVFILYPKNPRLEVRVLAVRIGLAGPYQQLQIEKWEAETGKINVDLRLHLLDQDQCVVGEA
jgi:hypothetical protein